MASYDDPEGLLQDQGLEVVVIPYRPPPAPPSTKLRHSPNPQFRHPPPEPDGIATPEGPQNEPDHAGPEFMPSPSSSCPPPSAQQLVTPRSQLAMVEAVCQGVDVSSGTSSDRSHDAPISPTNTPEDESEEQTENFPTRQSPHQSQTAQPPARKVIRTAIHVEHPASLQGQIRERIRNGDGNLHRTGDASRSRRSEQQQQLQTQRRSESAARAAKDRKLSYLQLAKLGYQELVHAVIRPPRSSYTLESLGPEVFTFCDALVQRRDFAVRNKRGMKIQCSLWSCHDWTLGEEEYDDNDGDEDGQGVPPVESLEDASCLAGRVVLDDWDENNERGRMYLHVNLAEAGEVGSSSSSTLTDCHERVGGTEGRDEKEDKSNEKPWKTRGTQCKNTTNSSSPSKTTARHPVVIYLHGNSSSRLEVIPQLGHLLSLGVSILSFDFCGSGHSEGDYVSLGYYEREDLDSIIRFLRSSGQVSSIALWGRSMGAATALMYASRDPTISCMILDSPFTDLQRLSEEIVEKGRRQGVAVPNIVLQMVMRMLKSSVKSQAGFNLRHISPISHADKCFVPAMFVAGEHDDFIHKGHSILIYRRYAGDKNIVIVDGDHNSPRPRFLQQSACLFLQSCMGLPASGELVVPLGVNLLAPPWLHKGARPTASVDRGKGKMGSVPGRSWLPLREQREQRQQRRKQRPQGGSAVDGAQGDCLNKRSEEPPELPLSPLNEPSRSSHDDGVVVARKERHSPSKDAVLAAAAPPDMSETQKDIQASLFKMLGQC
ncbi:hypothetical protein HJC23_010460 [Cyclotella cryptica]|uniref:AB hydrolase-1 domain-containing protein n=1 Tax=Cyclotella cryptica TaxID=29204 RepID=A0ABD3QHJ8_9STRA|eukprot:CCRYP_005333-RA/>CCRYP_005333-RA protein AED:0.20 eAED:0.00 QI:0/-1/0/1/-1/1/1/0/770